MINLQTIDLTTVGQILGIFLAFFGFFVYFAKTRQGILITKLISDVGYCIQQIMIGATTGALINGFAILREFVFYHRNTKRWASHRIWLYFFIVLMNLSPILTWAGPISLLPALGSTISVIALYCQKPWHTRIFAFLSLIPWIIYASVVRNYGMLIGIPVQMIASLLGLIRDYREFRARKKV